MNASILEFLKANGEQLDAQIAEALRMPMALVSSHVSQLSSAGEVICCKRTRYIDGKPIEGVSCRLSCHVPPPARGRKPGAKPDASPERNRA
jgi:predicted transcriptional regulator